MTSCCPISSNLNSIITFKYHRITILYPLYPFNLKGRTVRSACFLLLISPLTHQYVTIIYTPLHSPWHQNYDTSNTIVLHICIFVFPYITTSFPEMTENENNLQIKCRTFFFQNIIYRQGTCIMILHAILTDMLIGQATFQQF